MYLDRVATALNLFRFKVLQPLIQQWLTRPFTRCTSGRVNSTRDNDGHTFNSNLKVVLHLSVASTRRSLTTMPANGPHAYRARHLNRCRYVRNSNKISRTIQTLLKVNVNMFVRLRNRCRRSSTRRNRRPNRGP